MSTFSQLFPPQPQWTVDQISDLSGQVMIVTGGNAGIGKETIKQLLLHGAKVYMASRSPQKAAEAIRELQTETGKEALYLKLDLANLKSVKAAAEEFIGKETELHVLFNNGGVMTPPIGDITSDGYDLQFGTNVLGHFYFTKLLTPLLLSTAKRTPEGKARVVNTSSFGHTLVGGIRYETLKDSPERKKLGRIRLYAQSKFGNVLHANELHRRYADEGLVASSLHPGSLKTELQRHSSFVEKAISSLLLYPAPLGALSQLRAGTTPEGVTYGGKYLIPWARVGEARKETEDPELAKKLWEWMEAQVAQV